MLEVKSSLRSHLLVQANHYITEYNPLFENALGVSLDSLPLIRVGSQDDLLGTLIEMDKEVDCKSGMDYNNLEGMLIPKYNLLFLFESAFDHEIKEKVKVQLPETVFHELAHAYEHKLEGFENMFGNNLSPVDDFLLNCMSEGHAQYVSASIVAQKIEKELGIAEGSYMRMNDSAYLSINPSIFENMERALLFERLKYKKDYISQLKLPVYQLGYAYMKLQHQKGLDLKDMHSLISRRPKSYSELLSDVMPMMRMIDEEDLPKKLVQIKYD